LSLWPVCYIKAQAVTFDFDSGTPTLVQYQNLPADQVAGGVTARFSAISGNFSVQTDLTTGFSLPRFSGNYLYPNTVRGSALQIQFSRELTDITFSFATTDYPDEELPTPIVMTALSATSSGASVVGSVTNRAAFGSDTYPMGALAFTSAPLSFNRVEVRIRTGGDATFLVDNVTVTPVPEMTAPELTIWASEAHTVVVSWPSPSTGFELQANATLDTMGWVSVTNTVEIANGQNQVTISPATGNEFYRLFHP
jgi:hypothetical protein